MTSKYEQMEVAEQLISSLRAQVESLEGHDFTDHPILVFKKAFNDKVSTLPHLDDEAFELAKSLINVDMTPDVDPEVAEYLGCNFAEVLFDALKAIKRNAKSAEDARLLTELICSSLSVNFEIQ